MKKIGIVGSRKYKEFKNVENLILKLNKKYNGIVVVSGGQQRGVDGFAKKAAINNNISYVEFPPMHYLHNSYCIHDKSFYGQPYRVTNYFKRNKEIAMYSDIVFGFIPEGHYSSGTMNTLKHCKDFNKPHKVLS